MQNSIIVSDNDTKNLTVISRQNVLEKDFTVYGSVENPLFLAKDVAEWIEHSNLTSMINSVDDDEKVISRTKDCLGRDNAATFLTENGLYEVLMLSRKPIAKQFKKEVKKILHELRTNGGYIVGQENLSDEQLMAKALLVAQNVIAKKDAAIEEMKPKAEVFDRICNSETLKPVETVASNLGYGKNNFFALMRGKGIFFYSSKDSNGRKYNLPKQEFKDRGYFVTKEEPYTYGDKDYLYTKIYVTGKGEVWLSKILNEERG